ncbi:C40 family peptidase [Streptomyces sp. NRRL B-24484]|uniref:C40 family peptidase n=1 Tax=Streptomyces sp. NRRL B-24484 TaxID=1463833 RepID=UPI0006945942|nr:C40 family peptidase [Streptomyces sp. NRRL B-24484]
MSAPARRPWWRRLGCGGLAMGVLVIGIPVLVLTVLPSQNPDATVPVGSVAGIPARLLSAYVRAASAAPQLAPGCKGMTWQLLAGIGQVESGQAQGRQIADDGMITPPIIGPVLDGSGAGGNTTPIRDTDGGRWDGNASYDAAVGPMQFLPSTFAGYAQRVRPEEPGAASPNDADDETLAAALYLCGEGRDLTDNGQLRRAVYSYNASTAYVDEVLGWMQRFTEIGATGPIGTASEKAQKVINAAASQIGVPYSWGGGSESGPSTGICCSQGGQDGRTVVGFDCSGLMLYAFAQVGIHLPRVAEAQAGVGQRIPASAGVQALQPGDMVFFGNASQGIYHVGLYIGGGQMINAPKPGDTVKRAAVWTHDYAGGARVLQ